LVGAPILWLLLGGSLIYTAGMILNDAFDARYDREHRKERPIPSGRVTLSSAWGVGMGMLAIGAALCWLAADACGWLVLALVAAVLIYDAYHKPWPGSVFVMGACRTLLYLVAGSAAFEHYYWQWHLILVVKAIALGAYVVGLSLVARSEAGGSTGGRAMRWLGWFGLALPVLVGLVIFVASLIAGPASAVGTTRGWVNICGVKLADLYDPPGPWHQLALVVALGALIARSLMIMRANPPSSIGRAVGLLLAGIVVVDGLAISPVAPLSSIAIAACVPLLLLWQRKIAAT
jgi:4-hydroxybenzoate polyprenyltransferase